jgi:hypothetical protein
MTNIDDSMKILPELTRRDLRIIGRAIESYDRMGIIEEPLAETDRAIWRKLPRCGRVAEVLSENLSSDTIG